MSLLLRRFKQPAAGSVATSYAVKAHQQRSLFDFMTTAEREDVATFAGALNVSAAVNLALTYIKLVGGVMVAPPGKYRVKNIRLEGGALPWALLGAGPLVTDFVHVDGESSVFSGVGGSAVPYALEGFSVDAMYAEYAHAGAAHAISIEDVSGLRIRRVNTRNFKSSGILVWDDVYAGNKDNWIFDCHAVGNGVDTGNGMLIVNMDNSGFVDCSAEDCPGVPGVSPGIGLQLKNSCKNGAIINGWAKHCASAFGFGNDESPVQGVKDSQVIGGRSYGCSSAFLGIEVFGCSVNLSYVDMESLNAHAITCDGASSGNSYRIETIENINSTKAVFRFKGTAAGNKAHVSVAKGRNLSGYVAEFAETATNNHVTYGVLADPDNHPLGARALAGWNSTTGNSLKGETMPDIYQQTISSGVVTLRNVAADELRLDAEGGAASDDLVTIDGTPRDGQVIRLTIVASARDVVVKHGVGNILLNGYADFTLDHAADTLTLRYSAGVGKWVEVARGNCGG